MSSVYRYAKSTKTFSHVKMHTQRNSTSAV